MSEDTPGVRRVLLLLGFGAPTEAGLGAAMALAAGAAAELHGLFVEDEDLLRAAGLPISRVLGYRTAVSREVSVDEMERALRAHANRAEAMVHAAAARAKVGSSFRVARGRVVSQVVAASMEAELVLLDRSAPSLVRAERAPDAPALLYESGPGNERLLGAAASLASHSKMRALVLAKGPSLEAAARAGREAVEQLAARGIEAKVTVLPEANADRILAAMRAAGTGILVFQRRSVSGNGDLHRLLEEAPLPILIAP